MRVAIVVPRYADLIAGGAETLARGFAQEAARRGWQTEVWTTCASSHYDWRNDLPAGPSQVNGVRVHRFPITTWRADLRMRIETKLQAQGRLSRQEQFDWLESGPHSEPLYAHIAGHAGEFDAIVTLPYAIPLVHYASWIAPGRTLLWACLHDEAYAYMEPVRLLLENAGGVLFNSPEEMELATQKLEARLQRHAVLGVGALDRPPAGMVTPAPRTGPPYLLYTGRLEDGKNVRTLYHYVRRFVEAGHDLRLLVAGSGPLTPPRHRAFHYCGFVTEAEKRNLYAGALAVCQPSHNESFSLVIMESWLAGRPALVSDHCPVTRGHVERSRGGLAFRDYDEFAGAVSWLLDNPTLGERMGRNGRDYVLRNYTWEAVVDRFAAAVTGWQLRREPVAL